MKLYGVEAIYIWARVSFNGSRTFKENPGTYKNKETQNNHHLIEIKAHHQWNPEKREEENLASSTRSTEEKPRAVAKAVVTKKAMPITDSYFIYLIFHYHNIAYRKRLRGWGKEIEN